jgi:hypothetical protein
MDSAKLDFNRRIRFVQADLQQRMSMIKDAYQALPESEGRANRIVTGYLLHVIYGRFEQLIKEITRLFLTDRTNDWDGDALWHMTLAIDGQRPAIISPQSFAYLDNLRHFQRQFLDDGLLDFDPEVVNLALRNARCLEQLYKNDLNAFLAFLDRLVKEEGLE